MPHDDVTVVTRAFAEWNARGVDALLPLLDPDVEWRDRAEFPDTEVVRGRDAVGRHLARYAEVLDEITWEVGESVVTGEHVLTATRLITRGRSSGAETALPVWVVSKVRGGLIWSRRSFSSREAAEAEIGRAPRTD